MQQISFTLISSIPLTHDVFELIFSVEQPIDVIPGQYVMFLLPQSKLRRSYSIAYTDGQKFTFIIKRLEWWVGSSEICGLSIGASVPGMVPLGHFVLRDTNMPKLFIGTGTGFAPLYFQIRAMLESGMSISKGEDLILSLPQKLNHPPLADSDSKSLAELQQKNPPPLKHAYFVFGVRHVKDIFYIKELDELKNIWANFDYQLYLSQEELKGTMKGYVTDFLTKENIANFEEFYICGSPVMVKDARTKLESLGIEKEKIFFEQY